MRIVITAVCVVMLCGCSGTLSVRVDILDPAHVRATAQSGSQRMDCLVAASETSASIADEVAKIAQHGTTVYQRVAELYRTRAADTALSKGDRDMFASLALDQPDTPRETRF